MTHPSHLSLDSDSSSDTLSTPSLPPAKPFFEINLFDQEALVSSYKIETMKRDLLEKEFRTMFYRAKEINKIITE